MRQQLLAKEVIVGLSVILHACSICRGTGSSKYLQTSAPLRVGAAHGLQAYESISRSMQNSCPQRGGAQADNQKYQKHTLLPTTTTAIGVVLLTEQLT